MSLKAKYEKVLDLGKEFEVKDGYVEEEPGRLRIGGVAETQYQKDKMWDEIKRAGGESPSDIEADIKVANTNYYHKHTVKSGESLSLIAKHYYRDPMKYKQIFEANTDQLKNPDLIHPGQQLVIPNLG
ncbi:MAG: LysM peptidoglycan-binding domain-containing protein [Flavobacteriales bacterium]|nr:LysM peptidoglycan-binding domain-containing protein [Flavobacteriales bacterium]